MESSREDKRMTKDFINQPKFHEVVTMWEKLGYEVLCDFYNHRRITSVIGKENKKHFSFMFRDEDISLGQFTDVITLEELEAVKTTVTYVQNLNI